MNKTIFNHIKSNIGLALCLMFLSGCSALFAPKSEIDQQSASRAKQKVSESKDARASLFLPAPTDAKRLPDPDLAVTPEVKYHMRAYGGPKARFIQGALEQRDKDFPYLEQIFRDEGIPVSMLNLAMVESGFRSTARSPMGAVGMWQFMKSTAKIYGLEVGVRVDERTDPILSTIAAARHLKDLYAQYGDWYLVLAAYNAGTGAMDRILRVSGERDFWKLARSGKFSRQTAEFVPKFIAATLLINTAIAERERGTDDSQFASIDVIRK